MQDRHVAVLLVGYQKDYFYSKGALVNQLQNNKGEILSNTISFIEKLFETNVLIINTPICFKTDFSEITDEFGVLQLIKQERAFAEGSEGAETIDEIKNYNERIITIAGKKGLDAFSAPTLLKTLRTRRITDVIIVGVMTSLCIDSTVRSAFEKGFRVHIASDCIGGKNLEEQRFYLANIFPQYARILTSTDVIQILDETLCEVA